MLPNANRNAAVDISQLEEAIPRIAVALISSLKIMLYWATFMLRGEHKWEHVDARSDGQPHQVPVAFLVSPMFLPYVGDFYVLVRWLEGRTTRPWLKLVPFHVARPSSYII